MSKPSHKFILGDALDTGLPDESVDLVVTSPPYFGQREYLDSDGEIITEAVGSEASVGEYLTALDAFMVEMRRVIKPSGSVWVNLGDKYAGSGGHNNSSLVGEEYGGKKRRDAPIRYVQDESARPKSLYGIPWRFAISQIDAGWILRAEVVWDKPNSMPESVTDRVTRAHEQWFHFVKEGKYYAAMDELRAPVTDVSLARAQRGRSDEWGEGRHPPGSNKQSWQPEKSNHPLGKLPRSVQRVPTTGFRVSKADKEKFNLSAHYAPFPPEWVRFIVLGWSPVGATVLDPFAGSGTTSIVCSILSRSSISIDISDAYIKLARWRLFVSDHPGKIKSKWAKKGML